MTAAAQQAGDCLMLAAGLSRRMGCWKMALPYGGGTLLDSSLDQALAHCRRVLLVTGYRSEVLERRYGGHPRIALVHNPHYRQGMFSSIQAGAAALDDGHFFLALGDMPAIDADLYRRLWGLRGADCLVPRCRGRGGHPVLLPPALRAEIAAAPCDSNLKVLMSRWPRRYLEVADPAIHQDVDTPTDYLGLRPQLSA